MPSDTPTKEIPHARMREVGLILQLTPITNFISGLRMKPFCSSWAVMMCAGQLLLYGTDCPQSDTSQVCLGGQTRGDGGGQ